MRFLLRFANSKRNVYMSNHNVIPFDQRTRQPLRLKNYDYSETGSYFITINAKTRTEIFGQTDEFGVHLNPLGQMINQAILYTPTRSRGVSIDTHIVMPDHIHAIMTIGYVDESTGEPPCSIPSAVHGLKSYTDYQFAHDDAFIDYRSEVGWRLWQRSYFERVIRNARQLEIVREYIQCNPIRRAERLGYFR